MQRLFALIWMVVGVFSLTAYAQPVHIDIEASGVRKMKVAMPTYVGPPEMAGSVWAVCEKDLQMSGIFEVISPQSYISPGPLGEVQPGNLKDFALIGADYVITATVGRQGTSGQFKVQVVEISSAQVLMSATYTSRADTMYMAVHTFMDTLLKEKFAIDGIFTSKIVAIMKDKGQKQLYVSWCDGTGGSVIRGGGSLVLNPAWSPDGKKIAFVSYARNNPDCYILDVATGKMKLVSSQRGINITPAFDPSGTRLACTLSVDGNPELYSMDLDGTGRIRLTSSWATDTSPSFSPDGRRMVFCSSRAGNPQIFIMDVATKNAQRISFEGTYNTEPVFSPRGDLVAFCYLVKGEGYHIAVVQPDGSKLRVLPGTGKGDESPAFSPDGRLIAFASSDGNIYVTDLLGTTTVKVTSGGGFTEPAWSRPGM
ncbi:MAG: LpqB family beta-propeller domain-containing protein [Syntrophaceae bacterium]|nr:LpqB family beta-propeller domain-containing protein [Deltaproteobacteria bacterium]